MLSILHFSFQAVAPILILIIVGFGARKAGLWDEHTLRKMNRVNFRLGLSTLMYCNLYQIDADMPLPGREVVFVLVMLVLLTVIGFLAAHFLTPERTRKGVLAQCAFRSNYAIIGLVLAESIAGQAGVELGTIFQLPSVLYFNFMSVLALSIYSGGESTFSVKKTLGTIAKNPMIIGLLLGALTILIRRQLPLNAAGEPVFLIKRDLPWAYNTVSMMSRIATPNALLILGGQLDPGHAGAFKKELVSGVFLPGLCGGLCRGEGGAHHRDARTVRDDGRGLRFAAVRLHRGDGSGGEGRRKAGRPAGGLDQFPGDGDYFHHDRDPAGHGPRVGRAGGSPLLPHRTA